MIVYNFPDWFVNKRFKKKKVTVFLSPQYSFFETVCLIFRSQACIIKPEPLKRMIRSRRLSSFPWNLNLLKFFVADATSINSLVHWPWLCSRFLKAYKRELCSMLPEYWNCAYSYEFQQILCHWENWCVFFSLGCGLFTDRNVTSLVMTDIAEAHGFIIRLRESPSLSWWPLSPLS